MHCHLAWTNTQLLTPLFIFGYMILVDLNALKKSYGYIVLQISMHQRNPLQTQQIPTAQGQLSEVTTSNTKKI